MPQRWGVLYFGLLLAFTALAYVADDRSWPHQVGQACMVAVTVATLPVGLIVYPVAFLVALYSGSIIFPTTLGGVLALVAFVVAAYGNLVFFRRAAKADGAGSAAGDAMVGER